MCDCKINSRRAGEKEREREKERGGIERQLITAERLIIPYPGQ